MTQDKGTLYLVGTPIGNLEDMSPRAIRVLSEVDCVAAEDTRQTRKLFSKFSISNRLISLHRHNENVKAAWLVSQLEQGQSVALVSDAGMPGIADPGEVLVRLAAQAGIVVISVPGPSAVLAALSLSGLDTSRFVFEGFLPKSGKLRKQRLEQLKEEPRTMAFFAGPHQILRDLADMRCAWGERQASVSREITKYHEETRRGDLSSLINSWSEEPPLGEMVLIVQGAPIRKEDISWEAVLDDVRQMTCNGTRLKTAASLVAEKHGLSKREVYNRSIQERERHGDPD